MMKKSLITLLVFAILVFAESKGFLANEESNPLLSGFDDDFEEAFISHFTNFEFEDETQDDEFDLDRRLLIPESSEALVYSESVIFNEEDLGACGEDGEAALPPKGSCITVTHCYMTDIPRIGKKPIYKTKVVCN